MIKVCVRKVLTNYRAQTLKLNPLRENDFITELIQSKSNNRGASNVYRDFKIKILRVHTKKGSIKEKKVKR